MPNPEPGTNNPENIFPIPSKHIKNQTIGGRSAAVASVPGGGSTGGCNVLVDAGGGVTIYGVSGRLDDSVDACWEAEKIVSQSASRLPE